MYKVEKADLGIFNSNFLLGMVLAKDLPKEQKLLCGLTAGLFPKRNMMGPVLLKPQIDARIDLDKKRVFAEDLANKLQLPLEIEISAVATTAALTIKLGVVSAKQTNSSLLSPSPPQWWGQQPLLASENKLAIPANPPIGEAILSVTADGVTRQLKVKITT